MLVATPAMVEVVITTNAATTSSSNTRMWKVASKLGKLHLAFHKKLHPLLLELSARFHRILDGAVSGVTDGRLSEVEEVGAGGNSSEEAFLFIDMLVRCF
ncbi:hypothetical protein MA16_Dca004983 [Dendrobium catenatum]|uniref:Uncharacterized protein n=1 Tax=Dendrobium catenatum TaxID=906689 RepID=A0A2I0WGM4_9ASPA|nr:hypothetical protein MA16_Dca004983 [Dendrobium catenatum]